MGDDFFQNMPKQELCTSVRIFWASDANENQYAPYLTDSYYQRESKHMYAFVKNNLAKAIGCDTSRSIFGWLIYVNKKFWYLIG